jgi:hypothetical protein
MDYENILDAAQKGTIEDVKYFIENKGVDVNVRDAYGNTPLHAATGEENLEVVKFLVSEGKADVNAKDINSSNDMEFLKYLISQGANVNAMDNEGNTPLYWIGEDTHSEFARYLISQGAVGAMKSSQKTNSGGCYIATAVYGSYDAPEVLCLRQFRDEALASSVFGRLFIMLYYQFSLPIAEKLKNAGHINMIVRKTLDKFVEKIIDNRRKI